MRARKLRFYAIALGVAVALGGCGGSASSASGGKTFATAEEVHAAIESGGITCANYSATNPADINGYKSKPAAAGSCEVDGQEVRIVIWQDKGQADNEFGYAKTVGCALGKAFGVTEFYVARGPNWFASTDSQTVNAKVAKALGVEDVTIKC